MLSTVLPTDFGEAQPWKTIWEDYASADFILKIKDR